jgi:hypothetical protein
MHSGRATIFVRYQPSLLDRPRIFVHRSTPNLLHVTASETYPVNTQSCTKGDKPQPPSIVPERIANKGLGNYSVCSPPVCSRSA